MNEELQVGELFGRFCRCLAVGRGDPLAALSYAEAQAREKSWRNGHVVMAIKAATDPVGGDAYAGSLGMINRDFAAFLRPRLLIGKIAGLRPVPFSTSMVVGVGGTRASWVAGGEPIPATHGEFATLPVLDLRKVATIAVLTQALVRVGTPKSDLVIAEEVAGAIAEQMDRVFIDPAYGATNARPASITHGAASHNSSGSAVAAIDADLRLLVDDLVTAGMLLDTAVWAMHPQTAIRLALMRNGDAIAYPNITAQGGTLAGLPVVTSGALSASGSPGERNITLLEASEVNIADDGEAELDVNGHAALQLDDSPSTSAQPLVSLWSNGLVGVRAIRYVNWQLRRAGAVSVLRSVTF